MNLSYLFEMVNIIELLDAMNFDSLISIAEFVEVFVNSIEAVAGIITNTIVVITGACAIRYFGKLKEKNYNAIFGYYSRLIVRLYAIRSLLEEYQIYIVDRFRPQNERREINPAIYETVDSAIKEFTSTAEELLVFLKSEEDQMPASSEWPNHYIQLLLFLHDCVKLKNDKYFNPKYADNNKALKQYIDMHKSNIDAMIKSILSRQEKMARRLDK